MFMHENERNTHRRATQQQRACYREHLMVHLVSGPLGQQRPDRSSEHQQRETLSHDRSVLPIHDASLMGLTVQERFQ
jgi:hypothetical protein